MRLRCLERSIDRDHFSQLLGEWFQADMKTISRQLLTVCEDLGPGDQLLQALDNPVLVVAGKRDPMVHISLSLRFAELFSQAECYVHPHSTHFMIFEYPEELAGVLTSFLRTKHSPRTAQSPA